MSDSDKNMLEGLVMGWRHTPDHEIGANITGQFDNNGIPMEGTSRQAATDDSAATGVVGFLLAIPLFPFFVLFRTVTGPFASDLRWPRPTRIVSILGLCSLLAWVIEPDFKAMRDGAPDVLVAVIEWGWIGAMIMGIATIPAAIFMLNRRS